MERRAANAVGTTRVFPGQWRVPAPVRRLARRPSFLVIKEANDGGGQAPNQIAVVLNWFTELQQSSQPNDAMIIDGCLNKGG
jgi:hypothetical protein